MSDRRHHCVEMVAAARAQSRLHSMPADVRWLIEYKANGTWEMVDYSPWDELRIMMVGVRFCPFCGCELLCTGKSAPADRGLPVPTIATVAATTPGITAEAMDYLEHTYRFWRDSRHSTGAERELARMKLMAVVEARRDLGQLIQTNHDLPRVPIGSNQAGNGGGT